MADNFLENMGISNDDFADASGTTVTAGYEALDSGVYPGTIENIILYTQEGVTKATKEKFTSDKLQINVKLNESGKVISFKNDISKKTKDGTTNKGFINRIKSLAVATNFDANNFRIGKETTVSSYGKQWKGNFLDGINGKPIIALVRKDVDINKADDDMFKSTNSLEGIVFTGSEDIQVFKDKVEKYNGVFNYKGYVAQAKTPPKKPDAQAKTDLEAADF